MLDAESVSFIITCFFVFSLLLGKYLYCIVVSIFVYYLLTYFVFLNLQKKIAKKKSRLQVQSIILFRFLVRNEEFSIIYIRICVKFCTLIIYVICFNN